MQPLQELLHRIRWDADFARGTFALGYYDRIAKQENIVDFTSIHLDSGAGSFSLEDEEGLVRHIPLHRVRAVYRNGVAIWRRGASTATP